MRLIVNCVVINCVIKLLVNKPRFIQSNVRQTQAAFLRSTGNCGVISRTPARTVKLGQHRPTPIQLCLSGCLYFKFHPKRSFLGYS